MGPEDASYGPTLDVELCRDELVLGVPFTVVDSGPTSIVYRFSRLGSSYAPRIVGTLSVHSDGTDGRFIAVMDGSFETSDADLPVIVHLELDQPVDP